MQEVSPFEERMEEELTKLCRRRTGEETKKWLVEKLLGMDGKKSVEEGDKGGPPAVEDVEKVKEKDALKDKSPEKADDKAAKKGVSSDTSAVNRDQDWDHISDIDDDWDFVEGDKNKTKANVELDLFNGQGSLPNANKQTLMDLGWVKLPRTRK